MSFNLPPNKLLKLTKGSWKDVSYPTTAILQANLSPQDYFEPVAQDDARSCIPAGGKNFSLLFNANTGRISLKGETMFEPLSVTFQINDNSWNVVFVGSCMQVTQTIYDEKDLDAILTNFEHTVPALLSVATGLAIFCETVEIGLGGVLEARAETIIPPCSVRVVEQDFRMDELVKGIKLIGVACDSPRFTLASSYLREALYFDSSYYEHNPYTHSLITILKCAQAIEILFGGKYESIREKCQGLGIDKEIIETDIIQINMTRNKLGSGHSSSFVPTPAESEALRHFARRAVHTVQQILIHISHVNLHEHQYLIEKFNRDKDNVNFLERLQETVKRPLWSAEGGIEMKHVIVTDSRL